jgi:aryl-alcohol dehydrogenase-like predicted oxidoreductase
LKYRCCGTTDLELSVIGLGCWSFGGGDYWGPQDQGEVDAIVRRALDLGVNYFDTAEGYNEGRSEQSLGEAIQEFPRGEIVIGTKVAPSNTFPETLRKCCEQSLLRLGTDYIDIYMVHWPIHVPAIKFYTSDQAILRNPPSATEAFETLLALKKEGKILHIGVSNFGKSPLDEALTTAPVIAVNQLAYSLIARAIEWEILPYCQQKGVGVLAYMPLWQGLLTDRISSMEDLPPVRRRTRHFDCRSSPLARHGERGAEEETEATLRLIRELARCLELPAAQLALSWSFAHSGIVSSIVGARSVKQLETNVESASLSASPAVIAELNEITRPLMEKLGPSFDYFEGATNDRTQYR